MRHTLALAVALAVASPAWAETPATRSLDQLLEAYRSDAPGQPEAEVRLEGWIEERGGGRQELVIVLDPHGDTKLNADPGILVTPATDRVRWQVPLPYRHIDASIDYFEPNATVRMPFDGAVDQPIVVLVEFAYCVVDFQCFFGEEELTVAARD
ncbi:MAG: hypothetical protein R3349_00645 [Geminicoccaceae bacterium]|nr:hypothetical protein [Geminicoccaceae bacterium]